MINGVRTVVILEKDINEGTIQEAELNFRGAGQRRKHLEHG